LTHRNSFTPTLDSGQSPDYVRDVNYANDPNDKSRELGPTRFTRLRPDEDARLLEVVALGEHGETVSEVIRAAIRSFLRKLKRVA
jgi:hypothetical protein